LWRFHAVHHVDLDLDASTALRFHFGELAVSVPYRAAQVVLLGVDLKRSVTGRCFFAINSVHHSNVRLGRRMESALSWFLVTPRMHGIHHFERAGGSQHQLVEWFGVLGPYSSDIPA